MRMHRIIRPGAVYHITARANHKEKMFSSPLAKKLFIEIMGKMRQANECDVYNFVVMENHVHLLINPRGNSTLPEIMKWLLGTYSMGYNRVFKTWGHFWGGRYFSRPINGLLDLANTLTYIDHNPVRAFLVTEPEQWEWGGLKMHRLGRSEIMGESPPWLPLIAPNHVQVRLGS